MRPWNARTCLVMERHWKQNTMGAGVPLRSTAAPAQ